MNKNILFLLMFIMLAFFVGGCTTVTPRVFVNGRTLDKWTEFVNQHEGFVLRMMIVDPKTGRQYSFSDKIRKDRVKIFVKVFNAGSQYFKFQLVYNIEGFRIKTLVYYDENKLTNVFSFILKPPAGKISVGFEVVDERGVVFLTTMPNIEFINPIKGGGHEKAAK